MAPEAFNVRLKRFVAVSGIELLRGSFWGAGEAHNEQMLSEKVIRFLKLWRCATVTRKGKRF